MLDGCIVAEFQSLFEFDGSVAAEFQSLFEFDGSVAAVSLRCLMNLLLLFQ